MLTPPPQPPPSPPAPTTTHAKPTRVKLAPPFPRRDVDPGRRIDPKRYSSRRRQHENAHADSGFSCGTDQSENCVPQSTQNPFRYAEPLTEYGLFYFILRIYVLPQTQTRSSRAWRVKHTDVTHVNNKHNAPTTNTPPTAPPPVWTRQQTRLFSYRTPNCYHNPTAAPHPDPRPLSKSPRSLAFVL